MGPMMDCGDVPRSSCTMAGMFGRCESYPHVGLPGWAVWPPLLCLLVLIQCPVPVLHLLLPALLHVMGSGLLLNVQLWFQAGRLTLPL